MVHMRPEGASAGRMPLFFCRKFVASSAVALTALRWQMANRLIQRQRVPAGALRVTRNVLKSQANSCGECSIGGVPVRR